MRVNLHDFSGHPFQVQLSRALAARGHEVLHGYSSQYITGHGRLDVSSDDPATLRIEGLTADVPMVKYSPVGRTRFELAYADAWANSLATEKPDVVVACNVPLFTLARMRRTFARNRQPWVLWHQDIYSLGVASEATRRLPAPLARLARTALEHTERAQVAAADAVVAIGEPFTRQYESWGLSTEHVRVIPNWAPLDDLVPGERDNPWAKQQELPNDSIRLLYAGTLGRKHNPLLLLELLDAAKARGVNASLVVVSEGVGADELSAAAAGRPDVRILGYQPAEDFSDVLASADVLVALLEPDAAQFSVPSKVLSYLCAGRPIIALVPAGNPSAADVRDAGGFVAAPDSLGVVAAAGWLASASADLSHLSTIGQSARSLASDRFDIDRICTEFESILAGVAARGNAVWSSHSSLASGLKGGQGV